MPKQGAERPLPGRAGAAGAAGVRRAGRGLCAHTTGTCHFPPCRSCPGVQGGALSREDAHGGVPVAPWPRPRGGMKGAAVPALGPRHGVLAWACCRGALSCARPSGSRPSAGPGRVQLWPDPLLLGGEGTGGTRGQHLPHLPGAVHASQPPHFTELETELGEAICSSPGGV